MAEVRIACLVEGPGDAKALPVLLHRLWSRYAKADDVLVARDRDMLTVKRQLIVKPGELERAIELASGRSRG